MTQVLSNSSWILRCLASISVICGTIVLSECRTFADPLPPKEDGTLRTRVIPTDKGYIIMEGTRSGQGQGANLFHSFEEFNIKEGQSVYFQNPDGVQRIFSRVTGRNRSEINGTLGIMGGNADLFLINPNGILFGRNASLDLKGSFIATTASSVIFDDGSEFSVNSPSSPALLTVNIPIGLQFRETAGDIVNQSQFKELPDGSFSPGLQVLSGKTLALVGGNITLSDGGVLQAASGRIELGSVASPGQVNLHPIKEGWTLSYEGVQNFQDIKLTQSSLVSVIDLTEQNTESESGGNIQIKGRQIFITDASQILGGGANIVVTASDTVEMTGNTKFSPNSDGSVDISFSGIGNEPIDKTGEGEGQTVINARRLIISNGGRIQTSSEGVIDSSGQFTIATGNAGNIQINTAESVELVGSPGVPTGLFSRTRSLRNAGNININTRNLVVRDGAQISAESSGVDAKKKPIETGQSGDINIITDSIELDRDSVISTAAFDLGKNAGNIVIKARVLNLNQGTITAQTNRAIGNQEGANIRLRVADIIKLRNESKITATSTGTANGGNITIDTRFLIAYPPEGLNGSDIRADSQGGKGGKIDITAQGVFGTQIRNEKTAENDITAFSELNPNLNGVINFNTPDIDPSRVLVQFSTVVINPTTLINQDPCIQQDESHLVISGRGGLPPSIIENINDRSIEIELVKPVNSTDKPQNRTKKPRSTTQEPIIPARGWVSNGDGKVVLTAYDPTATAPQHYPKNENVCPAQ